MIMIRSGSNAASLPCSIASSSSTEVKQNKALYVLFVSIFLFPNLVTPFNLGNRIITLSEIIIFSIILTMLPGLKIRLKDFLLLLVFVFVGLISVAISIEPSESFKSFLSLVFFSVFTFTMVQTARSKPYFVNLFLNAFLSAVFILAVYGIFQAISAHLFGPLDKVIYPFGIFTWHTQSQLLINWRANSLYYEPNIFGMVSVFGLMLNLYLRNRSIYWNAIVLIGIILSFATTTYFMLLISLVLQLLIGKRKFKSMDNRKFFLVTILVFFSILAPFTDLGVAGIFKNIPVLNRISELSVPGTSGYYRITAPISSIPYMLSHYPLGIGIGTIDLFLDEAPSEISGFFVKGHSSYGKTIDNIILGWIFSFGLFSLLFLWLFFNILRKTITQVSVGLPISMLIFCWGTGSFLFFEFWSFLIILIFLNLPFAGSGRGLLGIENLHA